MALLRKDGGEAHRSNQTDPPAHQQAKIPTIKQLNQEYAQVLSGKKAAYAEYREARKQMQDLHQLRCVQQALFPICLKQKEQAPESNLLSGAAFS